MSHDTIQRLIDAATALLEARDDQMVTAVEWDNLRDAIHGLTTPWFVSTLSRYVVVDAIDEADARTKGHAALVELFADVRARTGKDHPIQIQVVRKATPDEVAMCGDHARKVAEEEARTIA